MKVACLCPTYQARQVVLVGNSIACFEAQTCLNDRGSDFRLVVYDDTDFFQSTCGTNWDLLSESNRHPTLSAKYNHMAAVLAPDVDAYIVWEDDDIYLPWHVESCVAALERGPWVHPSKVLSLYTGKAREEGAAGRFHASLAFHREALEAVGGWPDTARADFDQQLIRNLRSRFGPPADPLDDFPPSYVFRWASTGCRHGQTFMRGSSDEGWFARAAGQPPAGTDRQVVVEMDAETREVVQGQQKEQDKRSRL